MMSPVRSSAASLPASWCWIGIRSTTQPPRSRERPCWLPTSTAMRSTGLRPSAEGEPVQQDDSPAAQLVAERCATQLLSGPPAASPVDVVRQLLAVQRQHPRGARLAIRARTAGMTAADVDRAMTVDRSLLITWLNRGTLHLV